MAVKDRIRSGFSQLPSKGKDVDEYLTSHLPELLDRYDIARGPDLEDSVDYLDEREETVAVLHQWRTTTSHRIDNLEGRVTRLEVKYGVR